MQLESRLTSLIESGHHRVNVLFDGMDARVVSVEARLASMQTELRGVRDVLDVLVRRLEDKHVI